MTTTGIAEITSSVSAENLADQELLARMLDRNTSAWREFHRRYDRLIYRCIHKVTAPFRHTVSAEDIREVYAMFLMNLTARDMHKLRCFAPERGNKLSSWIGMLATNTAWDFLRAIARQPQHAGLAAAHEVRCAAPDPCENLMSKERVHLLQETLRQFSSRDRRFVRLYFLEGLTPEEIAEEMNISVKTVYSKKHKIRCRLEQVLTQRVQQAA